MVYWRAVTMDPQISGWYRRGGVLFYVLILLTLLGSYFLHAIGYREMDGEIDNLRLTRPRGLKRHWEETCLFVLCLPPLPSVEVAFTASEFPMVSSTMLLAGGLG